MDERLISVEIEELDLALLGHDEHQAFFLEHVEPHDWGISFEERSRFLGATIEMTDEVASCEDQGFTIRQPGQALERRTPQLLHQIN